jgi:LDH2 family malate/lactate/ureidoglycolate dehydrogenase
MLWKPFATMAPSSFFSEASSSNGTISVFMSNSHSRAEMVPRHATTISRYPTRPASAAPATATYPIQLAWPSHAPTSQVA